MPDPVRVQAGAGVTEITLDRPPVNAMDLPAIEALTAAFAMAAKAVPVILTGGGDVFSAGVDTKAFGSYAPADKAAMIRAITRMTAVILSHPAPVVAAVNGHALGGGFVLMLCADVRLVTSESAARFGLTEAKAGVPFPAGPLEIIRAEVEANLLRRLTLTSAVISAAELSAHGLADQLVAPPDLLETARRAALETAAQPAFGVVKRQVRSGLIQRVKALAESGDDPLARSFET
jgi:enoyl-CoA hydratase